MYEYHSFRVVIHLVGVTIMTSFDDSFVEIRLSALSDIPNT